MSYIEDTDGSVFIRGRFIHPTPAKNSTRARSMYNQWFHGRIILDDDLRGFYKWSIAGRCSVYMTDGTEIQVRAKVVDNGQYGLQIQPFSQTDYIEPVLEDKEDIIRFLSSNTFSGIGEKTAEKIYRKYGSKSIPMLQDHLDEVARTCRLKNNQVESIRRNIWVSDALPKLRMTFPHMDESVCEKIIKSLGEENLVHVINRISNDPYTVLMREYNASFWQADAVYMNDIPDDPPHEAFDSIRIEKMLEHALLEYQNEWGASYISLSDTQKWTDFLNTYFVPTFIAGQSTENRQKLPKTWDGARLSPILFLNHLNAWDYQRKLRELVVCQVEDNNGVSEYRLYIKNLLTDEQWIARAFKRAYEEQGSQKRSVWFLLAKDIMYRGNIFDDGMVLTDEQKAAILNAFAYQISFITGGPGTGKTTVLRYLTKMWQRITPQHTRQMVLLAPTGRAAVRLKLQAKVPDTETAARFLLRNRPGKSNDGKVHDQNGDVLQDDQSTLVLVDEVSMLGLSDASDLFHLLPNATYVFVGDIGQLPPVNAGNFLYGCEEAKKKCYDLVPMQRLTRNMRTEVPALFDNAQKIRNQDDKLVSSTEFMILPYMNNTEDKAVNTILDFYKHWLGQGVDPSDILVLTPYKKDRYLLSAMTLNARLQEMVQGLTKTDPEDYPSLYDKELGRMYTEDRGFQTTILSGDGQILLVGDRVMNIKNNMTQKYTEMTRDKWYSWPGGFPDDENGGIYNGDLGEIIRCYPPDAYGHAPMLIIRLDNTEGSQTNKYLLVEADLDPYGGEWKLADWNLGYASTVHKAQGSEADYVIFAMSPAGAQASAYGIQAGQAPFLTTNLLYTAVTRAKKEVHIIGDYKAVQEAIKTPAECRNMDLSEWMMKAVND